MVVADVKCGRYINEWREVSRTETMSAFSFCHFMPNHFESDIFGSSHSLSVSHLPENCCSGSVMWYAIEKKFFVFRIVDTRGVEAQIKIID